MLTPSPSPGEHSPHSPLFSPVSALFPFRYPCLPPPRSCASLPPPPRAPVSCCCTRFSLAPWHPLNSQLALPVSLRFPVPTTLAESCSGSLPCGPLALAPQGYGCWGPGGASEGTAGAAAPRSATHVVLGLLGVGGGGPCGDTAKPAPRHQAWQCPDCGGPGSGLLLLKPVLPGLG